MYMSSRRRVDSTGVCGTLESPRATFNRLEVTLTAMLSLFSQQTCNHVGKKAMIGTLIEIATLRIDQLTDDKFESPPTPQ